MRASDVRVGLTGNRLPATTELVVAFELKSTDRAGARTIPRAVSAKTEASGAGPKARADEAKEVGWGWASKVISCCSVRSSCNGSGELGKG